VAQVGVAGRRRHQGPCAIGSARGQPRSRRSCLRWFSAGTRAPERTRADFGPRVTLRRLTDVPSSRSDYGLGWLLRLPRVARKPTVRTGLCSRSVAAVSGSGGVAGLASLAWPGATRDRCTSASALVLCVTPASILEPGFQLRSRSRGISRGSESEDRLGGIRQLTRRNLGVAVVCVVSSINLLHFGQAPLASAANARRACPPRPGLGPHRRSRSIPACGQPRLLLGCCVGCAVVAFCRRTDRRQDALRCAPHSRRPGSSWATLQRGMRRRFRHWLGSGVWSCRDRRLRAVHPHRGISRWAQGDVPMSGRAVGPPQTARECCGSATRANATQLGLGVLALRVVLTHRSGITNGASGVIRQLAGARSIRLLRPAPIGRKQLQLLANGIQSAS
jgi:hypothetical protein